jgi:hypothetical protein
MRLTSVLHLETDTCVAKAKLGLRELDAHRRWDNSVQFVRRGKLGAKVFQRHSFMEDFRNALLRHHH